MKMQASRKIKLRAISYIAIRTSFSVTQGSPGELDPGQPCSLQDDHAGEQKECRVNWHFYLLKSSFTACAEKPEKLLACDNPSSSDSRAARQPFSLEMDSAACQCRN